MEAYNNLDILEGKIKMNLFTDWNTECEEKELLRVTPKFLAKASRMMEWPSTEMSKNKGK